MSNQKGFSRQDVDVLNGRVVVTFDDEAYAIFSLELLRDLADKHNLLTIVPTQELIDTDEH